MQDVYFLSASEAALAVTPDGERVLWSGNCAVAEYAFEEPASLPRWTLPEQTEVVVTDTRVLYADPLSRAGSELVWLWPQHLRLQPGNMETGRAAIATQIQLVCGAPQGAFPALVFAGGDLATVADADRLANVFRQAIARFRVDHAAELGLSAPQSRMLSRQVIGPEFANYPGGEGQTVSLPGALPVELHARPGVLTETTRRIQLVPVPPAPDDDHPAGSVPSEHATTVALDPSSYAPARDLNDRGSADAASPAEPATAAPDTTESWADGVRPGLAADAARAREARLAELEEPALAARAAELAARVARLVSGNTGPESSLARFETRTTNLAGFLNPPGRESVSGGERRNASAPADSSASHRRAEALRHTAARFAGNSARARSAQPNSAQQDLGDPANGVRKA